MTLRNKGILALLFLAALYAGTGVITRFLNGFFTPFQQLYIRLFLAFLIGFILFRSSLHFQKLKKITKKEWVLLFVRSFISFVVASILWIKGASLTKLANVTFIDSLPLTASLSFLFWQEKVTFRKIVLIFLSCLGVLILAIKDYSQIFTFGLGELFIFISGILFAFRSISRKWHTSLLNDQEITMLMICMGIIMLLIASFFLQEQFVIPSFSPNLLLVLIIGGFVLIANIFLTNFGFANVPAVLGNNLLNLEAAFGIAFGFLFYREISSMKELIGGILIVISVILLNREERKKE
jgi:drug/metabolite transporter (DMT)-like permease